MLRVGFGHVNTLAVRHKLISKRYPHFRERSLPSGLPDALATLRLSCSTLPRLRHRCKTRYGWVASPYPTGTFTLQDAPSFAQRDNAQHQRRREAPQQGEVAKLARAHERVEASRPDRHAEGLAREHRGAAPVVATCVAERIERLVSRRLFGRLPRARLSRRLSVLSEQPSWRAASSPLLPSRQQRTRGAR